MIIGFCKASKGILEKDVSNSKQLSTTNEGKKVQLVEEELSKISKRESARTNGSVSLLAGGVVEGMLKRLTNLASKMSTSSVYMEGAERTLVGGRNGCV